MTESTGAGGSGVAAPVGLPRPAAWPARRDPRAIHRDLLEAHNQTPESKQRLSRVGGLHGPFDSADAVLMACNFHLLAAPLCVLNDEVTRVVTCFASWFIWRIDGLFTQADIVSGCDF